MSYERILKILQGKIWTIRIHFKENTRNFYKNVVSGWRYLKQFWGNFEEAKKMWAAYTEYFKDILQKMWKYFLKICRISENIFKKLKILCKILKKLIARN